MLIILISILYILKNNNVPRVLPLLDAINVMFKDNGSGVNIGKFIATKKFLSHWKAKYIVNGCSNLIQIKNKSKEIEAIFGAFPGGENCIIL